MPIRHVRVAVVILTCWIVGGAIGDTPIKPSAPTTEPAESKSVETVWYDIHELLNTSNGSVDLQSRANLCDEIKDMVTDAVDPTSWELKGGNVGKIRAFGSKLIITQTSDAHARIKPFLETLRLALSPGGPGVIVDAYWVRLAPSQLRTGETTIPPSLLTDPTTLYAQARAEGFESEPVTCSVTRTVDVLTHVTPVVAPGVVAYDPTVSTKQSDATLVETPSQIADGSITVNFESTVTMQPESEAGAPSTRPTTDPAFGPLLLNGANQLVGSAVAVVHTRSAVRLKLGVPTIVSGMSDHPGANDNRTLCLVLCANVSR